MGAIRGDDLRRNVKGHLRNVHDIVRFLGSDAERRRLAERAFPPMPREFDRAVGRTFRLVDGVMTAIEAIAEPLRPRTGDALDAEGRLAGRLERLLDLLATVEGERPAQSRGLPMRNVARAALAAEGQPGSAAAVFLALAGTPGSARAALPERRALRTFAAAALMLHAGIAANDPAAGAADVAENALLLAGARLEVFEAAARGGTVTPELLDVLERLARHLAST